MQHLLRALALTVLCLSTASNAHPQPPLVDPDPYSMAEAPAPAPAPAPASCAELAARNPQAGDGYYWLELRGQPVHLYCHDMAGSAREYLAVPDGNCSAYRSHRGGSVQQVQTCFDRVRLDPQSLRVDVSDLRFAHTRTQGRITHAQQTVQAMPYATAMACDAPGLALGQGRIDLRGTPFAVDSHFVAQGYLPEGQAVPDASGQTLQLHGGGYCGWLAAAEIYNPHFATGWNPFAKGNAWLLQLRLVQVAALPAQPPGPNLQRCYWMENYSGQYQWVPADPLYGKALSQRECQALDSCNGGGGQSGGGCYRWGGATP